MQPTHNRVTPLGRVLGLGSAHAGTGTFIAERFTGAALLLLVPFVVSFGFHAAGRDYAEVREFIASPWVSFVLIAFLLLSAEHMRMGMRVIIEDYVHGSTLRPLLLFFNTVISWSAGLVGAVAVMRIAV